MIYFFYISILLIADVFSSEIPCREFEVLVRDHEVKAYKRDNGSKVSSTHRKSHCLVIYPGTENWLESFRDSRIPEWPYEERFKQWDKKEKEIILQLISRWPEEFASYEGLTIHRATVSKTKGNPAGILPKSKALVVYDDFFRSKERSRILSHEMAHYHILILDPDKLKLILKQIGWDYDKERRPYWTGKNRPLIPDSLNNPSEDLANHIEYFLHQPQSLTPEIRKSLIELLGNDFKLKEKK